MAENPGEEDIQRRVRDLLNKEKVKLWEPPYTNQDGTKGEHPQVSPLSARRVSQNKATFFGFKCSIV